MIINIKSHLLFFFNMTPISSRNRFKVVPLNAKRGSEPLFEDACISQMIRRTNNKKCSICEVSDFHAECRSKMGQTKRFNGPINP